MLEPKANSIGNRIHQIRETLGLNQSEFADLANSSQRAIQNYELGKSTPGGKILKALASKGFNINWVLTGDGEMKQPNPSESFPLLKNTPLLESIMKAVHEHFSDMRIELPADIYEELVVKLYREIQKESRECDNGMIIDVFSTLLTEKKGL